MTSGQWETVVGLEVHTELITRTKLFCGCKNRFGDEPNTNVCPVCLGLPGSLPVLNRQAVEYAMRIGTALHCRIQRSIFHRKNYFYPDMPKDYQISQYDLPINTEGWLDLPDGRRIGIVRAHMEEDTGKSTHLGGGGRLHGADHSLVDYNRSGVPLVEIVSAPDLRGAEDAKSYVEELRAILVATGASDGKMEEGSLRVDANVSVRQAGTGEYGTRCEIKNMNSLRSLGRAIDYEAERQIEVLASGGVIAQQTRHWNDSAGRTEVMRSKEEANDYRYFPEPDLVPVEPSPQWVAAVAAALPQLPAERRQRVAAAAGVPASSDAVATVVRLGLDGWVAEALSAGVDAALALKRLANEVAGQVSNLERLTPEAFVEVVSMESKGDLTPAQARTVLREMIASGQHPSEVAARLGFEAMDRADLAAVVDQVISQHPQEWERLVAGESKLTGFFVGKVKAATAGKADLRAATSLLGERQSAG